MAPNAISSTGFRGTYVGTSKKKIIADTMVTSPEMIICLYNFSGILKAAHSQSANQLTIQSTYGTAHTG